MSTFWSVFIILLVVVNIVGCVWLLWWTSRRRPGEGETTGHVWDGDIREYNKPLPRWWINLFYLTIVFTLGYLIWYPGAGSFAGTSGWTSVGNGSVTRLAPVARMRWIASRTRRSGPRPYQVCATAIRNRPKPRIAKLHARIERMRTTCASSSARLAATVNHQEVSLPGSMIERSITRNGSSGNWLLS